MEDLKSEIISMSLKQDTLDKLDWLGGALKIDSRSEIIRNAVNLLGLEIKNQSTVKGRISALLVLIHEHANTTKKMHFIQGLVKTHLHNHLENKSCLDVFVLEGNASEIKSLSQEFQKDKKIKIAKLIIL